MGDPEHQLAAKIALIKQEFLARLKNDWVPRLRSLRQRFRDTPSDPALRDELLRLAHDMTGSGAVFGCDDVSAMGRRLEDRMRLLIKSGASCEADYRDLVGLIDELEAVCVAALRELKAATGESGA